MAKPTLSKAKALADKWFSLYVRLYAADYSGMCKCVTCGTKKHFKEIHAGHFVSRAAMAARFHEQNVNCQDPACNTYGAGRQYEHGKYIDSRYGKGTADKLMAIGHTTVKLDCIDLLMIAKKYRNLALIEAEKRGIDLGEPKANRMLDEFVPD